MTTENKIKLSTLPHAGSPGKLTAAVAAANGIGPSEALAELKRREDAGEVIRTGATRATGWTRA